MILSLLLLHSVALAVDVGGQMQSNFRVTPAGDFFDFQDTLIFSPWWKAGERVQMIADFDIRWKYPAQAATTDETGYTEKIQAIAFQPNSLLLRAKHEHLQITLGYQQILWNVASGVSLLNTINAFDLRDPTRFDRRLSAPAIHGKNTYGAWSMEIALVPWFTPALLPQANINLLPTGTESFSIDGQALDIRSAEGRLSQPKNHITNIQFGSRLHYTHRAFDIALCYFHGFDSLPQAEGEFLLTSFQTDQDRIDVGVPFVYPKIDIFGLGATYQLPRNSIGWIEVSYTIPQQTQLIASQTQLESLQALGVISEVPSPPPTSVTQDGQNYVKWIVGVERFFGPVLLNAQWLHGFVTERQKQDISDYVLLSSRWTITPVIRFDSAIAVEMQGALFSSDLFFLIQDEIELGFGGFFTLHEQDSTFSNFTEVQHMRFQANMQF